MNNMIRNALLALVLGLSIRGYSQSDARNWASIAATRTSSRPSLPRGLPRIISLHLTVMTTLPAPPMLAMLPIDDIGPAARRRISMRPINGSRTPLQISRSTVLPNLACADCTSAPVTMGKQLPPVKSRLRATASRTAEM